MFTFNIFKLNNTSDPGGESKQIKEKLLIVFSIILIIELLRLLSKEKISIKCKKTIDR